MAITTVLFDLDGTLLPMDQEIFVKTYLGLLAKQLAPHGYDPEALVAAIWGGTRAMIKNTGAQRNEAVFWDDFAERFGEASRQDLPLFDEFYRTEFAKVQAVCGYNPEAAEAVAAIKRMGFRVALATNPIFPATATEQRIRWAGLQPEDFELYTTYENACRCKPNPEYYLEVVRAMGVQPEECLMVGNDVTEDMVAQTLGMQVFLLTGCVINKNNADISAYPHGDFAALLRFAETLA